MWAGLLHPFSSHDLSLVAPAPTAGELGRPLGMCSSQPHAAVGPGLSVGGSSLGLEPQAPEEHLGGKAASWERSPYTQPLVQAHCARLQAAL